MSDERIIVGLDIGTTKICTVIGEIASDGVLDIIGEGTVPSDGLRKGGPSSPSGSQSRLPVASRE